MQLEGNLRKMDTDLVDGEAQYTLHLRDVLDPYEKIEMNALVGQELKLEYEGYINSILSGEKIKKAFGEGMTYKEFMESPQASPSIMRPELSRIHEGIALRDYEWEVRHHLQPHVVYISLTSNFKVGVTRDSNIPHRWIDQGATQAIVLSEVPYRQLAGEIEVALKAHISDKTAWQRMLKGLVETDDDITNIKAKMLSHIPDELSHYASDSNEIVSIKYPVIEFPDKVKSMKLDKEKIIEGRLEGIKGQYLIFDGGRVINIRSHSGYRVSISI